MTCETVLSSASQAGSFDVKRSVVDVEFVGFVRLANFHFGRAAGRIYFAAPPNWPSGEKRQTDCPAFFPKSLFVIHNLGGMLLTNLGCLGQLSNTEVEFDLHRRRHLRCLKFCPHKLR